ncbi:MAG: imidazole glycerol phosphate synthase subunit HisH [Candidatus Calescibacterium sp.]|nr:imidazole glycerol phosphate synthase subunit HisH [Candidatus Calescibacterium sp.]
MKMLIIIDYQMGNVNSIHNMIKKIGYNSIISSNPKDLEKATKIIIPGVGAFDKGIENMEKLKLIEILNQRVISDKIPTLGICLGMQLMAQSSEEGTRNGLGWIKTKVEKIIPNDPSLKIPHIGWNTIKIIKNSKLYKGMENQENRFYFAHSYIIRPQDDITVSTTTYGIEFVSSFEKDNIVGVQFHPEKSHKFGMQLLKNFIENY